MALLENVQENISLIQTNYIQKPPNLTEDSWGQIETCQPGLWLKYFLHSDFKT